MTAKLLTLHREITPLEGFSDAVFGFALTLLVVSLEVPNTYAELMDTMRGFGAFAVCFALLYWHARRHREELELEQIDIFDAQTHIWRHLLTAAVALVSIRIAVLLPRQAAFAGMIYFLLGPLHAAYGFMRGKARDGIHAHP